MVLIAVSTVRSGWKLLENNDEISPGLRDTKRMVATGSVVILVPYRNTEMFKYEKSLIKKKVVAIKLGGTIGSAKSISGYE